LLKEQSQKTSRRRVIPALTHWNVLMPRPA
jgi:hypothetical protein